MSVIDLEDCPRLRRGYRFQWEPAQGCHVLLYPEGMVQLNDSAAHILKLVDGNHSIGQIIAQLQVQFPSAADLSDDVLIFMETAYARFWLESC
ncbi:pyrroloquinoline quinone biosynthesis peptide chaperone PqqD [Denitrificimonas sp. JX-1]|uniref:PqqA binding protein n=1 Tax=Denitrificimonas halotolerans TaxID=3098930 RepID=A0ABU5GTM4_9GAMM|nr:pyrroloquinoline quinone biosynthesis peptide chaperone PqqD [Denitrificimonas sp. JX-1]MDY7220340.1 pyrroloquinoline quinone biosynthesis peptide chaperone PqqD [Denitrificimonas sp. JX-1]